MRWRNVDLAEKMISVRESSEETKDHGPRFKSTKTKKGLREITLPDILVETLSEHRRGQLEERLSLGLGKPPADALVFPPRDDGPQYPKDLLGKWKEACAIVAIDPPVTVHALRHTHARQLIKAKVDVVTVSRRLVTRTRRSRFRSTATCGTSATTKTQRSSMRRSGRSM